MNRSRAEIQKKMSRCPTLTPSNAYPRFLVPAVRKINLQDDLVVIWSWFRFKGEFCGCCMIRSDLVSSGRAVTGGHESSAAFSGEQRRLQECGSDLRRIFGTRKCSNLPDFRDDVRGRILTAKNGWMFPQKARCRRSPLHHAISFRRFRFLSRMRALAYGEEVSSWIIRPMVYLPFQGAPYDCSSA